MLVGRDRLYRYDAHPRKELLGTVYGGWMIAPEMLGPKSVVCSFGVGNDISFDLALIERFGLTVHGFDPSPEAIQFIRTEQPPPRYIFHPFGLSDRDGEVAFRKPRSGAMYSLAGGDREGDTLVILPVRSLPSIMSEPGLRRIDLLKMDIEGAEYALIDTLIESRDSIRQMQIEFHHRTGAAPLSETVRCVNRLREAGFQLFHVAGTGSEFSFFRPQS